ncbi:MAG TPA: hypothetical protein DDZ80_00010 [Cyanobacteria bacterium UBA8803]|nr:hypothetical protein [Cyanobacteria bacterium UBA9273]HBL57001.1 hypothetical protein [Cyanobacteria bacterium UBA8803]
MALKYLLDENVDRVYQTKLLRQYPELVVLMVGEPGNPPKSTPDQEILCWCEVNGFVLVTNNRASMPVHLADHLAQNRHIPGIFILNFDLGIGGNLEELILAALASEDDEYHDRIVYLPLP